MQFIPVLSNTSQPSGHTAWNVWNFSQNFNIVCIFYTFVFGTPNAVLYEILLSCGTLVEKHSSSLPFRFMFWIGHWHFLFLSTV